MKRRLVSILMIAALTVMAFTGCAGSKSTDAQTTAASTDKAAENSQAAGGDGPVCRGALDGVTLVVGTSGTYAPFSYFASDGVTLQGYDVDFLKALQEVLGFTIADGKIQDMDYGPLGTALSQGMLDIGAAALCATDERKKTMNFTDTYYDAGIVVIVGVDNDTIAGPDDLADGKYIVAVQAGTVAYEYAVANLPESCLQVYDSQALAYKAVEDGIADATIYDQPGTAYSISTGEINLKIVGEEFFNGQAPYALALSLDICKRYPDIVTYFNQAIAYLQETGKLAEIKAAWCK